MKKLVRRGLGTLAFATVAITIAHVPPVSGWLGWNHHEGESGVCPFGYGPKEVASTTAPPKAPAPQAARTALGFTFGVTTGDELLHWAFDHHGICVMAHHGEELECHNLPLPGLLARTAWFDLDQTNTLKSIRTVRDGASATGLAAAFVATETQLESELGKPTAQHGTPDVATLGKGLLSQTSIEYRLPGFQAEVRATNMGPKGMLLVESYAAL